MGSTVDSRIWYLAIPNHTDSKMRAINILHRYGRDQIHQVASIDGKRWHLSQPDELNRQ